MSENSILQYSEDITNAEAPPALPDREYPAVVETAEIRDNRNNDGQHVLLNFRINPDDYPPDYPKEIAPDGKLVPFRVSAEDNPASRFRMRRLCEALGVPMGSEIPVSAFVGMSAIIGIRGGEWDGVPREEVTKVMASL